MVVIDIGIVINKDMRVENSNCMHRYSKTSWKHIYLDLYDDYGFGLFHTVLRHKLLLLFFSRVLQIAFWNFKTPILLSPDIIFLRKHHLQTHFLPLNTPSFPSLAFVIKYSFFVIITVLLN